MGVCTCRSEVTARWKPMKNIGKTTKNLISNSRGIQSQNLQCNQQDTPCIPDQSVVLTLQALRGLAAIANALKQRAEQPPPPTSSGPARRRRGRKPSPRGNRDSDRSRTQAIELCNQPP